MQTDQQLNDLYERQIRFTSHYTDFENLIEEQDNYEKSLDKFRHLRMLEVCKVIHNHDKNSSWVTVGDGRFATDARTLIRFGARAIATDLDDTGLLIAHQAGFIEHVSKENAEHLSYESDQFDYALCKEAYHHFPRPQVAVHELLRVAKKAVVFIEPNDRQIPNRPLDGVLFGLGRFVAKMMRRTSGIHNYEAAGNYVYTMSAAEIEKIACGIALPECWIGYMDDEYKFEYGGIPYDPNSKVTKDLMRKIALKTLMSKMGLKPWGMIRSVLAKEPLPADIAAELTKLGFRKFVPPPNPYV
ncbi:MAG: class I SAM-dependent methyltransferase [Armatimonadetes bacterium]|nr:class I SAM-dependent methyltransferase [Armatimonadota bacterium]